MKITHTETQTYRDLVYVNVSGFFNFPTAMIAQILAVKSIFLVCDFCDA